jgi:capsular polysaccharide biosynthesis protein
VARKRLPETIAELFDYDSPSEASELSDTAAEARTGFGQNGRHEGFESSSHAIDVPLPSPSRARRSRKPGSQSNGTRRHTVAEEPLGEASEADGLAAAIKILPRISTSAKRQLAILAIAPVIIATAASLLLWALSPTLYAARSEVAFDIRSLGWDSAERYLATQIVIAESPPILSPVAAAFNLPVKDLEKRLQVEIVRSSGVMRIQYANRDAETAVGIVKAITDRYLVSLRVGELVEGGAHRLLTPASLLPEPVSQGPVRAALLGAMAGLVIAVAGVILRTQLWPIR